MKKIVILALHLGIGGAERVITNISNILCQKYDVEIISTYKLSPKPAFDLNERVKVKYLIEDEKPNKEELVRAIKAHNLLEVIKQSIQSIKVLYLRKKLMIEEIKKLNSDIIISTRIFHNKLLGKYGNKNSIKIAQEHNYHNKNEKYIKKVIKSLKNIDYFMPTSNELANFYEERLRKSATKVVYIPNSIEKYEEELNKLDDKTIISVGRLDKIKGFSDLIEVFNIIHKSHNDWRLKIVGDGEEKEKLQEKINSLQLEEVAILTGNKCKEELRELYKESSIYVMTSFSESFGLVLLEAQNFGIPVIAFDSASGAKEIIEDSKNGFLIEERNKQKMANKIIELMANKDLRIELGKNGKEKLEMYKLENVSKKWFEFLEKV